MSFPSSRNGSTTTMPPGLVSSSSGLQSDGVVRVLDVFVLCGPKFGPMKYAVYVFMLVDMFMLCYVQ